MMNWRKKQKQVENKFILRLSVDYKLDFFCRKMRRAVREATETYKESERDSVTWQHV